MRLLGFSTGSLAKNDVARALEMLKPHELLAVELSSLREYELRPLLDSLPHLELAGYTHISLHAPSKLKDMTESEVVELLLPQGQAGRLIILHPDVVGTPDIWRPLGSALCIENMDKRKPIGRTAAELGEVFERLPEARLCLDLAHARQIDPSGVETRRILTAHGERLAEIHLSEVNSACGHEPLNYLAIESYRRVAAMIPESVPIILESPVESAGIARELDAARLALTVPELVST